MLLAGTVLKNTGHVFACCVYAGTQTKISLNSKITKNKFSTLERSLNKYLIVMVVILMVEMTISTILSFTFDHEFRKVRLDIQEYRQCKSDPPCVRYKKRFPTL